METGLFITENTEFTEIMLSADVSCKNYNCLSDCLEGVEPDRAGASHSRQFEFPFEEPRFPN